MPKYRYLNQAHTLVVADDGYVVTWDPARDAPINEPHNAEQAQKWRDAGSPKPIAPHAEEPLTPPALDQGPRFAGLSQPRWALPLGPPGAANLRLDRGIDAAKKTLDQISDTTDTQQQIRLLVKAVRDMINAERREEPSQ